MLTSLYDSSVSPTRIVCFYSRCEITAVLVEDTPLLWL